MSAIGIMDGAFFVGRKEIVEWVNSTLDLNISKVEDAASGAIACQLLDIMYPGSVPMSKVNWAANKDFEYVANYKLLQTGFVKNSIDKYIDVDRLIMGKYMDNLEFLQWFKRFFELNNATRDDYDTIGQRSKGKGGSTYFPAKGGAAKKPAASGSKKPSSVPDVKASIPQKSKSPTAAASKPAAAAPAPASKTTSKPAPAHPKSDNSDHLHSEIESLKHTVSDYEKTINDLRDDVDATEKERDFYFEKLRDIEVLLQEDGRDDELTKAIFKILYATAEGFEPAAEGEVDAEETEEVSY